MMSFPSEDATNVIFDVFLLFLCTNHYFISNFTDRKLMKRNRFLLKLFFFNFRKCQTFWVNEEKRNKRKLLWNVVNYCENLINEIGPRKAHKFTRNIEI